MLSNRIYLKKGEYILAEYKNPPETGCGTFPRFFGRIFVFAPVSACPADDMPERRSPAPLFGGRKAALLASAADANRLHPLRPANAASGFAMLTASYSRTSGTRRFRSARCRTAGSGRSGYAYQTQPMRRWTPLVNVSLAILSLSFSRSYTILIMPSTVMVSLVTTRRHVRISGGQLGLEGFALHLIVGMSVLDALLFVNIQNGRAAAGSSSRKISAWSKFFSTSHAVFWISLHGENHIDALVDRVLDLDRQHAGVAMQILCLPPKSIKPMRVLQFNRCNASHNTLPPYIYVFIGR